MAKDLIDIILKYRVKDQSLIKSMQSCKLNICERLFTPDQISIYSTNKMLKEGTSLTLNLPRESASSTAKPRPANAIEKHEEYELLQEQMPQLVQNAYKSFEDFTSRIKSLALAKLKSRNSFTNVFRLRASSLRNICRQSFRFYCESTFMGFT